MPMPTFFEEQGKHDHSPENLIFKRLLYMKAKTILQTISCYHSPADH